MRNKTFSEKISVIVCTFNRPEQLDKCLSSVAEQDYPVFETIVIDDASTRKEVQVILQKWLKKGVRAFRHTKRLGIPTARNNGVAASAGKYIAFTDDDQTVPKNWLSKLFASSKKNNTPVIGGRVYSRLQKGYTKFIVSGNLFSEKKVFEEIGLFDPMFFVFGSDRDWVNRVTASGKKSFLDNSILVNHFPGDFDYNRQYYTRRSRVYYRLKNSRIMPMEFCKLALEHLIEVLWRARYKNFPGAGFALYSMLFFIPVMALHAIKTKHFSPVPKVSQWKPKNIEEIKSL